MGKVTQIRGVAHDHSEFVDGCFRCDLSRAELSEAMEDHPAGKALSDGEKALLEVAKWSVRIEVANQEYDRCLKRCRELNLSNTVIARAIGKSEAAVRMRLGRKGK